MQTTDFQQAENKQLIFSVADQMPYLRHDETFGDYYEVLEISEQAIDTTRLMKNMPFLKDHDHSAQLGAVKKFWLANGKLYVSVKFSRSKFAQSIKEDIIDLIRQNTSIGYYVNQFQRTGQIDGIPVLRAISWTPYECSSVSVPASVWVGYNRSLEVKEQKGTQMKDAEDIKTDSASERAVETEQVEETDLGREDQATIVEDLETKSEETTEGAEEETKEEICPDCNKPIGECECKACGEEAKEKECGGEMKPEEKAFEPTKEQIAEALKAQFEAEATEIRSLGELTGEQKAAEEFVAQKRSLDQFKTYLKTKNAENSKNSIQKENKMNRQYFSISKAIRNACSQYKKDVSEEYETQVITENKRAFNVDDADIVLSNKELHQRALSGGLTQSPNPNFEAGTDVGNALIATDYLPQEYVTYLRPQLTLEKTGYYSIPVNGNAISFAVCTSGSVAKMYNLDGELEDGTMKFATKTLTPHKAGVCIPVNYSMILQARPEIDALVEADVVNALYQVRDEQILIGSGQSGQCLGILNTPGIGGTETGTTLSSVALSSAWEGLLSAENEIRKANIFSERLSFVMNGDTYVKLCATPKNKDNCMAGFICENDMIKNFPVYVNNSLPANTILLGDFGEVAVADFEGLKLKVDDITYIKQGAIQIVATKAFDCVVRRPGAFCKVVLASE